MTTTLHSVRLAGIPVTVPNVVDNSPVGYYVSYNNYDTYIYGCDTTAIVIRRTSAFLILNGDHRKELAGMSLEQACAYFHANAHLKNHHSQNHQDERFTIVNGKAVIVMDPPGTPV